MGFLIWFLNRHGVIRYVNPLSFLVGLYFIRNHLGLPLLFFSDSGFKQLELVDRSVVVNIARCNCIIFVVFFVVAAGLGR